jgi:NAD(P)-dependent dehydrogenase (short-subunit alcohol dehydrogenase family)
LKNATNLLDTARARWLEVAPLLRGLLAQPTEDPDHPFDRLILTPLIEEEVLRFQSNKGGKASALTPAATADHLIRTKAYPCWIDDPEWENLGRLKEQLASAIKRYADDYEAYLERNARRMEQGVARFDAAPRVVFIPGLGAACSGEDVIEAGIAKDITRQTVEIKSRIKAAGTYQGLSEEQLFAMEYRGIQHAKLDQDRGLPLRRRTALVTGAAGAIGAGICKGLLVQGCHVAVTDLPGEHLDGLVDELRSRFGERVIGAPLDVTNPDSVAEGFGAVIRAWGGLDLLVVNAGIALVSSLEKMDLEAFQRLERVNVEGTLTMLRQAARNFRIQGTGGDVVLISTKNVFAPGATFGAYSATKAASHQLARIASLEMAELGVRVNMVSPDAVFSEGDRKSGLWAEVGPDRMRARGLDEKGLETYYQNRNLLKAKVTAPHVANAVLFFATRQTPTTGATIPVDGGLPDSTPR